MVAMGKFQGLLPRPGGFAVGIELTRRPGEAPGRGGCLRRTGRDTGGRNALKSVHRWGGLVYQQVCVSVHVSAASQIPTATERALLTSAIARAANKAMRKAGPLKTWAVTSVPRGSELSNLGIHGN